MVLLFGIPDYGSTFNIFKTLKIIFYFSKFLLKFYFSGSPFEISFNGSLFEIPERPPCYVRQYSLEASLILVSLYEMCLGVFHYISLYVLILHSTLACHQVPFSLGVSQNKKTSALQSNNSNSHYI